MKATLSAGRLFAAIPSRVHHSPVTVFRAGSVRSVAHPARRSAAAHRERTWVGGRAGRRASRQAGRGLWSGCVMARRGLWRDRSARILRRIGHEKQGPWGGCEPRFFLLTRATDASALQEGRGGRHLPPERFTRRAHGTAWRVSPQSRDPLPSLGATVPTGAGSTTSYPPGSLTSSFRGLLYFAPCTACVSSSVFSS